ncbi:MAG: DUF927 domain-containing protein [Clostridia bacterium]|nr:DUF927 domain-containing protein [Clostridia bacterium]
MNEIQIPDFTKEEYLATPRPFEWLNAFAENNFQLMQMLEQVSKQASSVGVKNFKSLFKAYQKSLKTQDSNIILNSTNFEGQELQLDCGMWTCDDFGVTGTDKFGFEFVACMHPIMPVQRLINIDSKTEKLKIAFKKGFQWRSVIVDKKTLASNNSILSLADFGVAVNSENSRYLVRYLSELESMNYERIPELNSVGRLGWIPECGFSPYVENLVFDGDATFKHFFESVRSYGSYEKWLEVAKSVRSGKSIPARIILAASFASVLVEQCGGLPFFVHLWGNTEGGKTVALMLAASVWANPRLGEYVHSFNGTGVAQELSAGFVNSLPLILDELQIVKEKKDFDQLIYQLTEGVGRQRGAKTGGLQKTGTWNNCIITSGEMPISGSGSGGGAVNRIIDVEYTTAIFENPVYVAETIKKNYGYAGRDFIENISDSTVLEDIRAKHKEYLKLLQQSESTDKQSMSAALILTADFYATKLIFKDGNNLDIEDIRPFLSTKTDVSQNMRAYEYIMDVVAMNENRFVSDISSAKEGSEIWGKIDNDYIYFNATKFNAVLRDGGYNSASFLSWLKANNLIDVDKKQISKNKKIGKLAVRCIWLKRETESVIPDGFREYSGGFCPFD